MNAVIRALALAVIVVSHPAIAQNSDASAQTPIKRQAPIGHRQPTVAGVEKAEAERGITGSSPQTQKPSDLDQRLIICQDC